MRESMKDQALQWCEEFELKVIQLYETVQVRHGLMLVGAPMGGKTTIMRTLADSLTRINLHKVQDAHKADMNEAGQIE